MKIRSRFKDYYDYVAHLYGGGDPKITYVREPLTGFNEHGYRPSVVVKHQVDYRLPDTSGYYSRFKEYSFKVLVIMDRPFMLFARQTATGLYSDYELYNWEINPLNIEDKYYSWSDTHHNHPRGEKSNNILALTKKVGQPVYLIEFGDLYRKEVRIQSEIPILNNLSVGSFYPAEQLYQDLAYFIGNTMKDSPDTSPPVVVDDLTRLQQYGFDKKISFRHRK